MLPARPPSLPVFALSIALGAASMIFDSITDLLLGGFVIFAHGAQHMRLNFQPHDEETRNFNRTTRGAAGVTLAVYMLNTTADDLGGYGRLFHFLARPLAYERWQVSVCLIVWSFLLLTSALRFAVGVAKPGRRDVMQCMEAIGVAMLMAGAWLWGAFVPEGFPAAADINLGLRFFYVYFIALAIAVIFVSLRSVAPKGLPDPSANSDNVMAGPASREKAEAALRGTPDRAPPRFSR